MVRDGETLYFTEEDKANITYKEYSQAEVDEQQSQFKKKKRKRRIIYGIILGLLIVATRFEQLWYWASIAICFMIFLIILGERIDRMHILRPYYIEIRVEKRLPVESFYDYAGADGMTIDFYPIEGHDTTSGYQSIFYIRSEQYFNVNVGDIIKKSLSVIGEDLPSAPDNLKNDRKREEENES